MREFRTLKLFLVATCLFAGNVATTNAQEGKGVVVIGCQVIPINDPNLFATKPGRLTAAPSEGDTIQKGEVIGKIDDTEALLSLKAAMVELEVAQKQAENNVDIRYAEAQEDVTQAEVDEAVEANRRAKGAMSLSEIRRRKFQHQRSILATEQAQRDHDLAGLQVKVANAKVQAAEHEWKTRRLTSEINGVVTERFAQVGEWVNAGDPIAKLVQLDEVRVIGYVKPSELDRNDAVGKPVRIQVTIGTRVEPIDATINYAAFSVDGTGQYKIWADIKNIEDRGSYAIHPGCKVEMFVSAGRVAAGGQFLPAPGQ